MPTPLQRLNGELWDKQHIELWIKRDDLAHPIVSGNKIRKLSFLRSQLRSGFYRGVISFGGPHSNHLHALAWLCREHGVACTLFIRSYEAHPVSPTLTDVRNWGAEVKVLSPVVYRRKNDPDQLMQWQQKYPDYLIIPEGGSAPEALNGIQEMINEVTAELPNPDLWICPVGTGATLAGMVRCKLPHQQLIGISALKSSKMDAEVRAHWNLEDFSNWVIAQQWHCGGYGKVSRALLDFLAEFQQIHQIELDPLYNGKAMYAFHQYVRAGLIPSGSQVVFVHTGGLQGWRGVDRAT